MWKTFILVLSVLLLSVVVVSAAPMPNYIAEFYSKESYNPAYRPYLEVNGQNVSILADAEVKSVVPSWNYGSSSFMRVQYYNNNSAYPREGSRIYIRAKIPSSVTNISSCKLYLYEKWDAWLGNYSMINASEITKNSAINFAEKTINWLNQPCGSAMRTFNSNCNPNALDEVLISQRYRWYSFDVAAACQNALGRASRNIGLVLFAW